MTTTKTISRRTCGAVLGLCVLSVVVPGAGADDTADWAHHQAQAQKEREEWQRQQEQAQRDREQADRDRQARDDWYKQQAQAQAERDEWYRQQAQTQKERDDWYAQQAQAQRDREQAERDQQARDEWYRQQAQTQKERDDWYAQQAQTQKERDEWYRQQAQAQRDRDQAARDQKERDDWYKQQEQAQKDYQQSILDGIERVKQQRDEILSKAYDDHPWARAGWTAGAEWTAAGWKLPQSTTTPPKAPVARRTAAGRIRFQAPVVPQPLLILNPFASQAMERQDQDRERYKIAQTREPETQEGQTLPQLIENPFVGRWR